MHLNGTHLFDKGVTRFGMVDLTLPIGLATGFALGMITAFWTKRPFSLPPITIDPKTSNIKLVQIVRTDLGMRKGKIAAQCSHATLGCYRIAMRTAPTLLSQWEASGEPKVTLRIDERGEEPLVNLYEQALDSKLVACMIRDAGRTQVARHSATVLSIGPAPSDLIDPLVKHLKLL